MMDFFFKSCAGHHCEEVDHCATRPCRNGATCVSKRDTYKCTCADGFTGSTCTTDIDECAKDPCVHGRCVNIVGSYRY